jgi:Tol biopolymer transport system component
VVQGGSDAKYVPTGHLLYATSGVLYAVPFDVRSLSTSGGRVAVVEGVRRGGTMTAGATSQYAVSGNGSLAFLPGPAVIDAGGLTLAVFDGTAPPVPLQLPPGGYAAPRVSPDGKWVAVESEDPQGANVLLYELSGTSAIRRLTFGGTNRAPVWSADSRWVAFQSNREGDAGIFQQRADGTGTAERLTKPERGVMHVPDSWSPDGAHLLFTVQTEQQHQLWDLDVRNRRAARFSNVQSPSLIQAVFSPDGRWVAYQSREPGGAPVTATGSANSTYVEPFPPTGAKYLLPVSAGHPYWSRKGDRLMFENGPSTTGWVSVTTSPVFAFGKPFDYARGVRISGNSVAVRRNSDAMPDGRIIGLMPAGGAGPAGASQITVVLNWFDELRARVR